MQYRFRNQDLEQLASDTHAHGGFPQGVAKSFRRRLQFIDAAKDERDLVNMRSNRFERLKGDRSHQHSIRLNDQWRLIFEIEEGDPGNTLVLVGIEDYH